MTGLSVARCSASSAAMKHLTQIKPSNAAVRCFLNGDQATGLEHAMRNYKAEFDRIGPEGVLTMQWWEEKKKRPNKEILTLMMQSLGPLNPLTIQTQAKLQGDIQKLPHTSLQPRYLEQRRGGLPRRLLNGKWMWEGSHWSIKNKNKMGSGYETNMFDRVGVL